jgi:hypothetical protein
MFKFRFALIMLLASSSSATGFAQDGRGTPEQRAACTSDAFRLCASYIPDPMGVESCLRQRKADLSNACRSVFEHGTSGVALRGR